jgi:transposase
MKGYPQIIVVIYRKYGPHRRIIVRERSSFFCDSFYAGCQYPDCMAFNGKMTVMNVELEGI